MTLSGFTVKKGILFCLVASQQCSDPSPSHCTSWAVVLWSVFTLAFRKMTITFLFAPPWFQVHVKSVHTLPQEEHVGRATLRSPLPPSSTIRVVWDRILFSAVLATLPRTDISTRKTTIPQSQRQRRARQQREASLGRIAYQIQSAGLQARCGPLVASSPCLGQRHGGVEKVHKPSVRLGPAPTIPLPRSQPMAEGTGPVSVISLLMGRRWHHHPRLGGSCDLNGFLKQNLRKQKQSTI